MSNIEYHEGHLAINVKDNKVNRFLKTSFFHYTETQINTAYNICREAFWEDLAQKISEKYGYGEVYSEGRLGGWLTVEFPPALISPEDAEIDEMLDLVYDYKKWEQFAEEIRDAMEYCCNERLIKIMDEISIEKERERNIMRIWTLGSTGVTKYAGARVVEGPPVMPAELVKTIELETILDLLENLAANFAASESLYPSMPHCKYIDYAKKVLEENGRLK